MIEPWYRAWRRDELRDYDQHARRTAIENALVGILSIILIVAFIVASAGLV